MFSNHFHDDKISSNEKWNLIILFFKDKYKMLDLMTITNTDTFITNCKMNKTANHLLTFETNVLSDIDINFFIRKSYYPDIK